MGRLTLPLFSRVHATVQYRFQTFVCRSVRKSVIRNIFKLAASPHSNSIIQSRPTGIADHILSLGDWLLYSIFSAVFGLNAPAQKPIRHCSCSALLGYSRIRPCFSPPSNTFTKTKPKHDVYILTSNQNGN